MGETHARDISGFGNHGVVEGTGTEIVYSPSKFGNLAAEFGRGGEGKNYQASSFVLDTSLPWTVSFWYRLDAYTDTFPGPFNLVTDQALAFTAFFNTSSTDNEPFSFGSSSIFATMKIDDEAGGVTWQDDDLGETHHIAITYNGAARGTIGNYKCYRDGLNQTLEASSIGPPEGTTRIGKASVSSTQFDGLVFDLRVNNFLFSAAEMFALQQPIKTFDLYLDEVRRSYSFAAAAAAAPDWIGTESKGHQYPIWELPQVESYG